jgi:hypothetical protein
MSISQSHLLICTAPPVKGRAVLTAGRRAVSRSVGPNPHAAGSRGEPRNYRQLPVAVELGRGVLKYISAFPVGLHSIA